MWAIGRISLSSIGYSRVRSGKSSCPPGVCFPFPLHPSPRPLSSILYSLPFFSRSDPILIPFGVGIVAFSLVHGSRVSCLVLPIPLTHACQIVSRPCAFEEQLDARRVRVFINFVPLSVTRDFANIRSSSPLEPILRLIWSFS